MVQERDSLLILEDAKAVVIARDFAEGAAFVVRGSLRNHMRSGAIVRQEKDIYASAENRRFFHLGMSRLQHTWTLRSRSMALAQTFLFRESVATSSRSTTVIPRVSSLETSISTQCSLEEVQSVGFSAMPISTGSGSDMPLCPVCLKNASTAVLLQRNANSARGFFRASTRSMSSGLRTASP